MTSQQPDRPNNAEFTVKRSFGIGAGDEGTQWNSSVAIFANRQALAFLSEFFQWMADREIANIDGDPGDYQILKPSPELSDEIYFTVDTLTDENRAAVLENAAAAPVERKLGSPIQQFSKTVTKMFDGPFSRILSNDDAFRSRTHRELLELMSLLQSAATELEEMGK